MATVQFKDQMPEDSEDRKLIEVVQEVIGDERDFILMIEDKDGQGTQTITTTYPSITVLTLLATALSIMEGMILEPPPEQRN